jgi:predicted metal-dependent hydrolase
VHLEKQGLDNRWQHWALRRIARGQARHLKPLPWLAITAAYEHITAVLAEGVLRHDSWMAGADGAMVTLWKWHAAEEIEHRAVAFDLYMAAGGTRASRLRWYLFALACFAWDAGRQTTLNLWQTGRLSHFSTWWHGAQFLLGREGLVWRTAGPLLAYFKRDFHPHHEARRRPDLQTRSLARRWLADNAASFRVVRY